MKDPEYYMSAANWITPAHAMLADIMNGPAVHLGVQGLPGGPTKRQIKRALGRIPVWGFMHTLDYEFYSFSVKREDAMRAVNALEMHKIAVLSMPQWVREEKTPRRPNFLERIFGG